MSESSMAVSAGALEAKQAQEKAYRKKDCSSPSCQDSCMADTPRS